MSDRCRQQPDSLLIEHAAIAALPAPNGPKFRAASIAGLRHRAECGLPLGGIASFATLPACGGDGPSHAYGEMFSEAAFGDLRRLGARSQILLRQPLRDRRSRLRRVVLLRSDDAHAGDGGLGAIASSPREQA